MSNLIPVLSCDCLQEEFTDVLPSPAAHNNTINTASHVNPAQQQQQNYKQRIRASAGGGMGPGFKQDTR